jgi:hypothetical protein
MKTSLQILHWSPRILCIMAILFVSMFALDAFDPRLTLLQQIGGFLMHLVPSFVLIACLIVAWKWELIGGIILASIGIGFSPFVYQINYHRIHDVGACLLILLMITFPFILVGFLFIMSHFMKKKNHQKVEM